MIRTRVSPLTSSTDRGITEVLGPSSVDLYLSGSPAHSTGSRPPETAALEIDGRQRVLLAGATSQGRNRGIERYRKEISGDFSAVRPRRASLSGSRLHTAVVSGCTLPALAGRWHVHFHELLGFSNPTDKTCPQMTVSYGRRRTCAGWDASECSLPLKKCILKRWQESQQPLSLPRKKALLKLWNDQMGSSLCASQAKAQVARTAQFPLVLSGTDSADSVADRMSI